MEYNYIDWLFAPSVNYMLMALPFFTNITFQCVFYFLAYKNYQQIALLLLYNNLISRTFIYKNYISQLNGVDILFFSLVSNWYYEQDINSFIFYLLPYTLSLVKYKLKPKVHQLEFLLLEIALLFLSILFDNWLIFISNILIYQITFYVLLCLPQIYNFLFDRESKIEQTLINNIFSAIFNLSPPEFIQSFVSYMKSSDTNPYTRENRQLLATFDKYCSVIVSESGICLVWRNHKIFIGSTINITRNILNLTTGENCPICDDQNKQWLAKCDHGFCKSCSVNWFSKSNLCPMCRMDVISD